MVARISRELRAVLKEIPEEKLRALLEMEIKTSPDGWSKWGATLPNGTILTLWHAENERPYWAKLEAGKFVYKEQTFDDLPDVTKEIYGSPRSIWEVWQVKLPGKGESFQPLKGLRTHGKVAAMKRKAS